MELRNRLLMSPMKNLYATREGLPSPRSIAVLEGARAATRRRDPYWGWVAATGGAIDVGSAIS